MQLPPPQNVPSPPALVKKAEDYAGSVAAPVAAQREQRLLRAAFNDSLTRTEQQYANDRAFRGSEEQLGLDLTFLTYRLQNGKREPSPRLDIVAQFSSFSREEIFKKAVQQDLREDVVTLEKRRDEITKKSTVAAIQYQIDYLERELRPGLEQERKLATSIERILKDPSVARELKTEEERQAAVHVLQKRLDTVRDELTNDECDIALQRHHLEEAKELSARLESTERELLGPIEEKIAATKKLLREVPPLTIRDLIPTEKIPEFLKAWAKLESPGLFIREARAESGEVSVASFGYDSRGVGRSRSSIFLFNKSGVTLSYAKVAPRLVENKSPRVFITEPDFLKFQTPSSQTVPQGDLALISRAATPAEQEGLTLSSDSLEIHSSNGALIKVGHIRSLSVELFGSPVIDMTRSAGEDETSVRLECGKGTGTAPLVLLYGVIPIVTVEDPLFRGRVSVNLADRRIALEGVHSLPVELHVVKGSDRVVKIPLTRPGAENEEFNSARAIRARIHEAMK